MRAWRIAHPGAPLRIENRSMPAVRAGAVRLRMEAAPLLSYMGDYLAGKLPYAYPPGPFTPGTNGVGIVDVVGDDVHHLAIGQRVLVHPHLVANEIVDDPAQILVGLTGISADSGAMLAAWSDGTLSEFALMPASNVAPLNGLEHVASDRLATLAKFTVPFGGLLRGRLAPGETLIVVGASGYYGSAAVLLALALGAERVVAAARSRVELYDLAAAAGDRVVPVVLSGGDDDVASLRHAAGGGAHVAIDLVGRAADPAATLAALRALRRSGRLVLMGSMTVPVPLAYGEAMANSWEVIGAFMYPPAVLTRLAALVRAGLLDLDLVRLRTFGFDELPDAIAAAAQMRGLASTVVKIA